MKYSGIAVLALLAGLLYQCWLMMHEDRSMAVSHAQESSIASKLAATLEVNEVDSTHLKNVNHALDVLLLSMNHAPLINKQTLIATKKSRVLTTAQLRAIRIRALRRHHVSMSYVSPATRYAVVDGKFVREGDRLRGGVYVKVIEGGRVRLSLKGTLLWLPVKGAIKINKKISLAEHGAMA